MSIAAVRRRGEPARVAAAEQAGWYVSGLLLGFLIPFLFTSVLDLNHDLYYGIYFAAVGVFLAAYAFATRLDVAAFFARRWRWSLALGVLAAIAVVASVLTRDSTPRPDGAYFAFTIAWRGLLYGSVDALLLSGFPVAVAYAAFDRRLHGVARKAGFGALALVLVMVITAVYHLGYEQFRENGVGQPELGNVIISAPAIITVNPLGAVVAHAGMHVAADVHVYETDVFLPPQRSSD